MRSPVFFILILLASCAAPRVIRTESGWLIETIRFEPEYRHFDTVKNFCTDRTFSLELVRIPGGTFLMGSPADEPGRDSDEGPRRKVVVKPFWMARLETSWDLYVKFLCSSYNDVDADLYPTPWPDFKPWPEPDDTKLAATGMPWHRANQFCAWLSMKTGRKFRLPTEAEWEYACRAGSEKPSPEPLGAFALYRENLDSVPRLSKKWHQSKLDLWPGMPSNETDCEGPWDYRAGSKKPNAFGLYDMLGGMWEYCQEVYKPSLDKPQDEGEHECLFNKVCPHVLKGGSYRDPAGELRAANRDHSKDAWGYSPRYLPITRSFLDAPFVGFRVVCEIE